MNEAATEAAAVSMDIATFSAPTTSPFQTVGDRPFFTASRDN